MRTRRICQQSLRTSHAADATAPATTANRKPQENRSGNKQGKQASHNQKQQKQERQKRQDKKKVNREIQEAKRGFVIRQKQR